MALIKELTEGNPDGSHIGQSTSDLLGFYGGTPVAQQTGLTLTSSAALAGGSMSFLADSISRIALLTASVNSLTTIVRGLNIAV